MNKDDINKLGGTNMRKKSMCIRFGARHNVECADLKFDQGGLFHWSSLCMLTSRLYWNAVRDVHMNGMMVRDELPALGASDAVERCS